MSSPGQSCMDSTMCEICELSTATQKCRECDQFMCRSCGTLHVRFKPAKAHSVVDLNIAEYRDAAEQLIEKLSVTRTKLRDEIEKNARKQKAVQANLDVTKKDIQHFASIVQLKCNQLCDEADDTADTLLEELKIQFEIFLKSESSVGTRIEEVDKLLQLESLSGTPRANTTSIKQKLQYHEDGNARINKNLLDKCHDTDRSTKLEFFPPFDGRIEEELILHVHPDGGGRGDSGAYTLPRCCDKLARETVESTSKPTTLPKPKDATCLTASKPLTHSTLGNPTSVTIPTTPYPTASKVQKPAIPPRKSSKQTNYSRVVPIPVETKFSQYIGKILDNKESIDSHHSSILSVILDKIWIITGVLIHVYDLMMTEEGQMKIRSRASGKRGLHPKACVHNSKGVVFIAFSRSQAESRHDVLNGLWTIHPTEGHVVDKLSSGGYVNVTCDDTNVIGLRTELNEITIHSKTNDDWVMTTLCVVANHPSLLTFNNCFYMTTKDGFVAMTDTGGVVKRSRFPSIEDTSEPLYWNLCDVDEDGRIILCEETTGRVFLYDTDETFTRIHFGEIGSDLENPTKVQSDCKGNLWIREETVYGCLISKFVLP